MGKKILLMLAGILMSASMAFAQNETVTGTVIDSDTGEPLVGASVKVDGTNTGTLTDMDGKFTLKNLPKSAKMVEVSFMGMNTVKAYIKPHMAITLTSNAQDLNEVMVIAYGTQKKSNFTGSAAIVGAEEIGKVQATNTIDAIRGKAAGVQIFNATGQPGSSPSILIRGINSLNAGNDPLIVLDGSPYGGYFNDINPADVESVTVLKDAASTALYGARGGNGVILITTKSAKKDGTATVTLDAKWGCNGRASRDYDMITHPAGYYETWAAGLHNYATNKLGMSTNKAWDWTNKYMIEPNEETDGYLGYNVYTVPQGQTMIGYNGKLNPNATLGRLYEYNGQTFFVTPDDWRDASYKNALRQEYTLSATAGNEKGSFYLSANYLGNEGITTGSNYNRFTGRLKGDYKLKDWLKLGANMSYAHFERASLGNDGASGSSGNIWALSNIAPIYPVYVRDGNGKIMYDKAAGINIYDFGDRSVNGLYRPYLSQSNPIAANILDTNGNNGNAFNGVGTADIYLPYGFTFTSINSVYVNESRYTNVTNRYYGQYASSNGQVYKSHSRTVGLNLQQRLNWHKAYGKHDIEAMIGHEYYKINSYGLSAQRNGMATDDNHELAGAVKLISGYSSADSYNSESWLGRAMYNYDERYFASASVMRQASSRFSSADRRWWGTFWSAGGGWMITKEKWFNAKWVNELKLKASYGENGNDAIPDYRYVTTYTVVNSNDQVSFTPNAYKNENISWEKNAKFNVGVDFSLFDDRLYGSIEYYSNRTNDMLSWFPLAPSFGFTGYYANVGNVTNKGVELDLHAEAIRTKDFKWNLYTNLTSNSNKITSLPEERKTQEKDGHLGFSSGSYFYTEGQSLYSYFTKRYAGVYSKDTYELTGKDYDPSLDGSSMWWRDNYKKDGAGNAIKENGVSVLENRTTTTTYSEASDYIVGDMLPDVYGGFGTSLEYKGFDLSVDFTYQLGGKVYDSTYAGLMGMSSPGYGMHVDLLNAWSPTNTNSSTPRLQYGDTRMNASSDRFITSANYLSLQNITFGYTLPKNLTKKAKINKARIYLVADNVWVWSKRKGLDPRQSITGGTNAAYYSTIRTISGGINLTF